jgi:acyl-[acyl-carrier-protein]-phospholipid O-acyltransferase / long-chain-fatty-acid--[acyl-carrier-protein] ligase
VIRRSTSIFETVNIRRDQPMEAIREIIRALKSGDVVCLFPEGQLTRTGTLCPLQRGFELIARKAGHPIIPVWVDGSWGSVFSFERNRFFHKIPHRPNHGITVGFGRPLDPAEVTLEGVRNSLLATSAEALGRRFQSRRWLRRRPSARHSAAAAFRSLPDSDRRRMWANGHQIAMVNALPRGGTIHVLADDPVIAGLPGLIVAFPDLFRTTVRFHRSFDGDHDGAWVGGDHLCQILQQTQITSRNLVFYDFGTDPTKCIERAGVCHCPCLAVEGVVIAMSMPDPPPSSDVFTPQKGRMPHALGRLLPGWCLTPDGSGRWIANGPGAPDGGLALPAGCVPDDGGFLLVERKHPRA